MSVAPHYLDVPKRDRARRVRTSPTRSLRNTQTETFTRERLSPVPSSRTQGNLPKRTVHETAFVKAQQLPMWLRLLLFLQHSSSIFTFGLITLTLAVYAWTVYIPKQWSKEFEKLETLQRNERHLTATNETLKNQLAQQAELPETGLARPNPSQSIFLKPVSAPIMSQPIPLTAAKSQAPVTVMPVSY
ncbi:MAG: hypothetical protein ACRDEA_20970 [Microcystaceae cyanobacterium]